jgi:hypothetical protein
MVLKVIGRIWERGIEASFGVGPQDKVGDLGLQLRAVLRTYAESSALEIRDPLGGQERTAAQRDIGAKAFRFEEVSSLFRTIEGRVAGGAACLSDVLRGWPTDRSSTAGTPPREKDSSVPPTCGGLGDYGALMHLCKSTFREPPQGRTLANGGGRGGDSGQRWKGAHKGGRLAKQQKRSATSGRDSGGGGSGVRGWASKGHARKGAGGAHAGGRRGGRTHGEVSSAIGKPPGRTGRKPKGGATRGAKPKAWGQRGGKGKGREHAR